MNFAHVSLAQDGGAVTGRYHDWGYTFADAKNAGQISGSVQGNTFSGTFQDNNPGDPAGPLTWTLTPGVLDGTYQYSSGQPAYPWCGVTAGQGVPLPTGCGWSDSFSATPAGSLGFFLQQIADEVTGTYFSGPYSGPVAGVVSDYRLNGQYTALQGDVPGRISFKMTEDGTGFSGNYFVYGNYQAWCAGRNSSSSAQPSTCLGGGGIYDGTWFTNLGTITLTQPLQVSALASSTVTGVWFFWGAETEYAIDDGVVSGPSTGNAEAQSYLLGWTDSSPLGGATGMTSVSSDPNGVTLQGHAVDGGLWCGVNYGPDPSHPDGGQTGTLYAGCGLTGQWNLWQPSSSNPSPSSNTALLVQTRGSVTGPTDSPYDLDSVAGTVGFNDAGFGSWTVVTGNWVDLPDGGSGTFTWYPDSQDQSFGGDFLPFSPDAGAWCGSLTGLPPSPCQQ